MGHESELAIIKNISYRFARVLVPEFSERFATCAALCGNKTKEISPYILRTEPRHKTITSPFYERVREILGIKYLRDENEPQIDVIKRWTDLVIFNFVRIERELRISPPLDDRNISYMPRVEELRAIHTSKLYG